MLAAVVAAAVAAGVRLEAAVAELEAAVAVLQAAVVRLEFAVAELEACWRQFWQQRLSCEA
jgi:phage shock protein A